MEGLKGYLRVLCGVVKIGRMLGTLKRCINVLTVNQEDIALTFRVSRVIKTKILIACASSGRNTVNISGNVLSTYISKHLYHFNQIGAGE